MGLHNANKTLENEILEENLSLFIRNRELSAEICRREVENVQLLGRVHNHEENERSLEKLIRKVKEDEVDVYLDNINIKKRLESSEKRVEGLQKYVDYLKGIVGKFVMFSESVNKLLNDQVMNNVRSEGADTLDSEGLNFSGSSEELFRETVKNCLKINNLLYKDIKEELKYKYKYIQKRRENIVLKNKIDDFGETRLFSVIKNEASLSIAGVESKNKLRKVVGNKLEIIKEESTDYSVCKHCNDGNQCSDADNSEKDYLLYSLKQYKKENNALKQKIFEYEFDNSKNEEISEFELRLKEKQREIDDLEKEYSLWVLNLQEENSELRIIIKTQEEREKELIEKMKKEREKVKKEFGELRTELIGEYEAKLDEKVTELNEIKSERMKGEQENTELENLRQNLKCSEESLKRLSEENSGLNSKIIDLAESYGRCEEELSKSQKEIVEAKEIIFKLKEAKLDLTEKLDREKMLRDKFEQEAISLKKELDNFLSDMYKASTQKKNRSKIIGEVNESESFGSVEEIIKHCKELENKVEELAGQLENAKATQRDKYDRHLELPNNAEIETLFDQVQALKKEREQLKKDIRQRDWAKVETEILQKKALEEADQLKRDNARLMLENLRLRDSIATRNSVQVRPSVPNYGPNDENSRSNSSRSSIFKAVQEEHHLKEKGLEQYQVECKTENKHSNEDIDDKARDSNLFRNSIQSTLKLKPPRRQSLLLSGQNTNANNSK